MSEYEIVSSYLTSLSKTQPGKAAVMLLRVFEDLTMHAINSEKWLTISKKVIPTLNRIRSSSYQNIWRAENGSANDYDLTEVSKLHLRLAVDSAKATFDLVENDHQAESMDTFIQLASSALVYWYLYRFDLALNYKPTVGENWKTINKLFSHIQRLGLENYPVMPMHERGFSTLGELYKRILILDVINPLRFSRRELLILDRLLLPWSKLLTINEKMQKDDNFILNTTAMRGLVHSTIQERLSGGMGINVTQLVALLSCWRDYAGKDKNKRISLGDVELSQECIDKIVTILQEKPERKFRRVELNGEIYVKTHLLSGAPDQTQWKLVNTSAQGYCLEIPESMHAKMAVGQLLQLNEDIHESPESWSIGVVRWVRQIDSSHTHIGIQLLAPDAETITIKSKHDAGDHALLLPENLVLGYTSSVIVKEKSHYSGDVVTIANDDTEKSVRLLRLVSQGKDFQQFACQVL